MHRRPATSQVAFASPSSVVTTATFDLARTYVLRLRAEEHLNMGGFSEEHHKDAFVTVTVRP